MTQRSMRQEWKGQEEPDAGWKLAKYWSWTINRVSGLMISTTTSYLDGRNNAVDLGLLEADGYRSPKNRILQ